MTQASTAQSASADPAEIDRATDGGPAADTDRPDPAHPGRHAAGGGLPAVVRRRLAPLDARLDVNSWIATAVVVAIAAILRLVGLSHPKGKIFDELYYATQAHHLLTRGFEWNEENNVAAYVVHPPLGKWMIALGEMVWGYNELGWRFSAAVIGTLSVLLLVRIGRRLFRSTALGCAAGLLLALDGFHLVLSRTALLDIFLSFFVLAAFGALVLDRDARRRRWLRALDAGLDPSQPGQASRPRPTLRDVPWWRLLAAVLLGCGVAVKWSALYFVPAFGLLVILWEVGARRSAGFRRPWRSALLGELPSLVLAGVLIVVTYLASWSGWFFTDGGYYRTAAGYPGTPGLSDTPVIGALQNLWVYHRAAFDFHTTLVTAHPYQSWPWQWLLLGRPVAFHWTQPGGCGASSCAQAVLLLGTPLLWWSFLPALAATIWLGLARRDWRAGAILLPITAGLLPWFYYALDGRTMFSFYAAPALPFLVLAVTYVLGAIISPARPATRPPRSDATSASVPGPADPTARSDGPATAHGTAAPAVDGTATASPDDTIDRAGEPGISPQPGTAVGAARPEPGRGEPDRGEPKLVTVSPVATDRAPTTGSTETGPDELIDTADADRRLVGSIVAGTYVLLVAICFGYFHPIFVGKLMPYAEWSARMWLDGRWI